MADLIIVPVADQIMDATYSCYDGACGTGGMLTVAQDRLLNIAKRRGKNVSKLATTSSTGGLSLALQRAIITARPKGRYRKHFYWPAIKRYYWNLLFSIPLLAHLYISELLHLLYCRLFQHNIL